jgi:hypothetical protein
MEPAEMEFEIPVVLKERTSAAVPATMGALKDVPETIL